MRRWRIPYSAAEMAWLEANRTLVISDYHRAFRAAFDRPDVSADHLHALRKRQGWKVGRAPGRTAGRHRCYSAAEIAWLKANSTMEVNAWCASFAAAFGRADMTPAKLHALRKRMGWKTGRSGRFAKGAVPWSKGRKLPANAASARTQFKAGQTPHNLRGPGHESLGADGYLWIIIDARNPWTGAATWRVHKHRWLWECRHGRVPPGHTLKCLDGDRRNTDPSNWEAVPRALLPRLNGGRHKTRIAYDAAPGALKPALMAVAKLEHAVRRRTKSK